MIRLLTPNELKQLYHTHMTHDFPPAELKPLRRMLAMQADGAYTVLAKFDVEDNILAYACFCHKTSPRLMDYYAVVEKWRGRGVGSAFLNEVLQSPYGETGIMVELESPAAACDDNDLRIRRRRVQFYERLGFTATHHQARIFGVQYDVYATHMPAQPVDEMLADVYHYFVPEADVFEREIFVSI